MGSEPLDSFWHQRLEKLLSAGRSAGADFVEVFLESTDQLSLLAEQDLITSVNPSFSKGAGIRVFLGNRDGFVSTNDLTEKGLRCALDDALGMLGLYVNEANNFLFDGLKPLKDYAVTKQDWLGIAPDLCEVSDKLVRATNLLLLHGKNLAEV